MKWKQKKKYDALLQREKGVYKKVWGSGYAVCLAYPHEYRVGMANLGFQTVYKIVNAFPSFLCERAFLPASGDDAEYVAHAAEMVSLESQKPLNEFDVLAFSISFENDYPAVLKMLDAAGIPLLASERTETHPLVIGGGIALTLNPEPVADFFDAFLLGEAEEILPVFAGLYDTGRKKGWNRRTFLANLQRQAPDSYVPSLYAVNYFPDGKIQSFTPCEEGLPEKIRLSPIKDIDAFCTTEVISSPESEMADMYLVEVNRGCPHLCRFCAAGYVYAPPRFRTYEKIIEAVDEGLARKKKIGLVGTAVSDHPDLVRICRYIVEQGAEAGVGSLRMDQISPEMLELLKTCGVETVALAPEAGSQRLRDLLHKEITANDILRAAEILIEKDMAHLRLYFMVGLPTEEEEDIDAIIELAKKIQHAALSRTEGKKKFRRITLSINQFIPKPRTPLQWCPLADVSEVGRKIKKIAQAFKRDKQINVIADVPKWNYVQALLALGDRRISDILLAVHRQNGHWPRALKSVNINPDFYVYRPKDPDEILPWDIVETGISRKHLLGGYRKVEAQRKS